MRAGVPVRIAARQYTPFLRPPWGEDEWMAVAAWQRGEELSEARVRLATVLAALGSPASVLASSGRSALRSTLQAAALPAGTEVIVSTYCCAAVAEAIVDSGLRPVLADVDAELNMTLGSVEAIVSPATSAVVIVHLGGVRARDGEEITSWARQRGLLVIDDLAQGSPLDAAARTADATLFSSGPGKLHFGPGGGWVDVPDPELRARVAAQVSTTEPRTVTDARLDRFLRRYPPTPSGLGDLRTRIRDRRGGSLEHGPRMTEPRWISGVDAAIAAAQLSRGRASIDRRRQHASRWRLLLDESSIPCSMATDPGSATKVWVMTSSPIEVLAGALWRRGVEMERLYTPLHFDARWKRGQHGPLSNAEAAWRRVGAVPVRPDLAARDWDRIERAISAAGRGWLH